MSYKASTTVNEPREVKKRLRVKSVLLAIVIVICLPLLRTPGELVLRASGLDVWRAAV